MRRVSWVPAGVRRRPPKATAVVLALLLSLAALPLLAACGSAQPAGKPALTMIGNENMGFLMQTQSGPAGFSADLAADIAKRMGRTLEVTFAAFPDLLPAVQAGDCDIAMSAISITPEREQQVSFSDPYFDSGQSLLVATASAVTSTADLKGATVGVLKDSTNAEQAKSIPGIKLILPFDSKEPMFRALEAGSIDAVICDTPFALYTSKATGKTRVAEELTIGDQYGIAVRTGNDQVLARINEALAAAKSDGTYNRLYRQYFGE